MLATSQSPQAPECMPPPQTTGSDLWPGSFDAAPEALLLIDAAAGRILAANVSFRRLAGATDGDPIGRPLASFAPFRERPELAAACLALTPGGVIENAAAQMSAADGSLRSLQLSASAFPSGATRVVRCSLRDVTIERIHEHRNRQTEKMESLRLFTGGVAHDFNNVLSCIRGYVSIALENAGLSRELREILTHVQNASVRAGELPRRLLEFSRRPNLLLQPANLDTLVTALVPKLQAALPAGIVLRFLPSGRPLRAAVDAETLSQALALLLTNAREAIGDSGNITLSIAPMSLPPSGFNGGAMPPENFARLSLRDSGCGMSAATQARLFEPGFTTKKSGRGSGMGLATVYRITAQHGGWIDVESAERRGSTFTLVLPLAEEPGSATGQRDRQPATLDFGAPIPDCPRMKRMDADDVARSVPDRVKMRPM